VALVSEEATVSWLSAPVPDADAWSVNVMLCGIVSFGSSPCDGV
jgi:hypothetical protein